MVILLFDTLINLQSYVEILDYTRKNRKITDASVFFLLFTFCFSLFFVPLHPLFASCDGGLSKILNFRVTHFIYYERD